MCHQPRVSLIFMLNGISQTNESIITSGLPSVTGTQECLARRPPGPCHIMVPTLCFHPSRTKQGPRLTPWGGRPRCSRRSLGWLGWHSGHSPTCHTASPGGKKSRWGSASSRWSSKPATWWSKHRAGTCEWWRHCNTGVLDPGWRGPSYPWQSNIRVLLIPQRESVLWKDPFPARVLQPNQINIYPGFKELSKVMGLSLLFLRFNPWGPEAGLTQPLRGNWQPCSLRLFSSLKVPEATSVDNQGIREKGKGWLEHCVFR